MEEIKESLFSLQSNGVPPESVRLVLVDGSVLSGSSLKEFLANFPPGSFESTTVFTGTSTEKGIRVLQQSGVSVDTVALIQGKPRAILSLSDCVPTLGGRMLGVTDGTEQKPLTVEKDGIPLSLGIDAFLGGLPHLVDMNPFDPDSYPANDLLLRELQRWSYQTAQGVWQWLELSNGGPLSWQQVITKTNGQIKVFVPTRNAMKLPDSSAIPETPLQSVYAGAAFRY